MADSRNTKPRAAGSKGGEHLMDRKSDDYFDGPPEKKPRGAPDRPDPRVKRVIYADEHGEPGYGGVRGANYDFQQWEHGMIGPTIKHNTDIDQAPRGAAPGLDLAYGNMGNDQQPVMDRVPRSTTAQGKRR